MSFRAKRRVLNLDQALLKKIKSEQQDLAPLVCVAWSYDTQTCGHAVLRNMLAVVRVGDNPDSPNHAQYLVQVSTYLNSIYNAPGALSPPVAAAAGSESTDGAQAAGSHAPAPPVAVAPSLVFVPTRPGHRQWFTAADAFSAVIPGEGLKGLFSQAAPSPERITPASLAASITEAAGTATCGCIIITDLSALCSTLGGEAAPLSLVQALRRKLPHCTLLLGMNTACLPQRSREAVTSLSTLFCECESPLVPLPVALRGPGTPGGRHCLGEVQSTDRSLQTGKATQALHPFVVVPSSGRLDYVAGLVATTTGNTATGAVPTADELEMRSVIATSTMSLTRTEEEDQARKAVQLSFQHTGGLAAVKGGAGGAAAASAAPVPENLITLDIGDLDSDSDSESEEEV